MRLINACRNGWILQCSALVANAGKTTIQPDFAMLSTKGGKSD